MLAGQDFPTPLQYPYTVIVAALLYILCIHCGNIHRFDSYFYGPLAAVLQYDPTGMAEVCQSTYLLLL